MSDFMEVRSVGLKLFLAYYRWMNRLSELNRHSTGLQMHLKGCMDNQDCAVSEVLGAV